MRRPSAPRSVLPDARDAFRQWYLAREDRKEYADKQKRYPVYVVAAQGGGIYAATHALTFLTSLQDACPRFAQHMFAISSVSGGSIGCGDVRRPDRQARAQYDAALSADG